MTPGHREPALAGVDIGSTRTKAVLCTGDGTVLASAVAPTPLAERDAPALVATALDTLARTVAAAGRAPDAVGLTGMAETGVPLGADGEPCGPLLAWSDPRGDEQAAQLVREAGAGALHAATGVRPSSKAPLAKWCWLRTRHPDAFTRLNQWAGAADLVHRALTGRLVTDPTFAQRTMAYDVHRGRWDAELTALAGLSPKHLPPVHSTGAPPSPVTAAGARRVPGLRTGTPVVIAGHDHLVGAWAAGARADGRITDSMGTAEAVLTLARSAPDPAAALAQGMGFGRHADGRHWYVMAGSGMCGALVEWFGARWLGLPPGDAQHTRLGALFGSAGPGPTGIVVEPYLTGRVAPEPDPDRTLAVHGLRPYDGPPRLALAIVEATAYQARWMAETQAALTGGAPREVAVLGGPTAQPRWMRVKAAVAPWRTHLVAEPHAPAAGAALLAGVAAGHDEPAPLPAARAEPGPDEHAAAYDAVHRERFLPLVRRSTPAAPPRPGGPHDPS